MQLFSNQAKMYHDILLSFNVWNCLGTLLEEEDSDVRERLLQMTLYAYDEVSYRNVSQVAFPLIGDSSIRCDSHILRN